jgi:hypothetical protein
VKETGGLERWGFYLCSEFAPGGLVFFDGCVPVDLGLLRGYRLLGHEVSDDVAERIETHVFVRDHDTWVKLLYLIVNVILFYLKF